MTPMQIPFSRVSINGNESRYIQEVLESGWLTTSSKTMRFEELFAQKTGAKHACAVNSCTSALHLAVEAIGIGKGDKVLLPSLTFTATAEVLRYMDAHPVFMDVDYNTRLITPQLLENALFQHPDSKALIPVHFGGQAAAMTTADKRGILDICKANSIRVIEDAAHAFPSKWDGRFVGTFGDITCFSFYANKTITTGEGGMLTTDSDEILKRVKIMRLHGINRDIWSRFTDNKSSWEYDVVAPGFKYNMPDVNAAIGLAQLEKADFYRSERQRCAEFYFNALKGCASLDLPACVVPIEDHAWHLFPVVLNEDAGISRNEFIERMAKAGIGTSVHYKPLHRMTYYRETYQVSPGEFPNTERIWQGTVSLPIYPDLSNPELEYICSTILSILK